MCVGASLLQLKQVYGVLVLHVSCPAKIWQLAFWEYFLIILLEIVKVWVIMPYYCDLRNFKPFTTFRKNSKVWEQKNSIICFYVRRTAAASKEVPSFAGRGYPWLRTRTVRALLPTTLVLHTGMLHS